MSTPRNRSILTARPIQRRNFAPNPRIRYIVPPFPAEPRGGPMRCSLPLVISLCGVLITAAPVRAQDPAPLPARAVLLPPPPDTLTVAERSELDAWLGARRKWQQRDKRWHNEPVHDALGHIRARTPQPDPPLWLEGRCAAFGPGAVPTRPGPLGGACRLLAGLAEDPVADAIRAATAARRAGGETVVKNSFLTRVHIDGLWTSTSTDVRMYGLFGSHISLVDVGRVQFFGPPGVIVLSLPDGRGSRELKAGYTWGMSVRLMDVRLFAPSSNLTLFLTMTKVWMTGGGYDRLASGGLDIAGFSLAQRKRSK